MIQKINIYDKILSPIVTEKSTNLSEQNKVTFKVPVNSSKESLKKAVEKIFKVNVIKINVINKGTSHGLNVSIPKGGHTPPISIAGDKLEWKNAQKKAKKNITSDTIKRTIPIRNPYSTDFVWFPSNVLSLTTSRHQINIIKIKKNKLVNNKNWPWLYPWKYITPPVVVPNAAIEVIKGHGLGSTKWKGWFWVWIFI